MKKSTAFIRSIALTAALFLAVSIFPIDAFTEQIFSDWFSVETEPADAQVYSVAGGDYAIRVTADEKAKLPEKSQLYAEEITDIAPYLDQIKEQLQITGEQIAFLRLFDLSIRFFGMPVRPRSPVRVEIDMPVEGDEIRVLHFARPETGLPLRRTARHAETAKETPDVEVLSPSVLGNSIRFDTSGFSVFAVVGYTLEKVVLASDGNLYHITVSYGEDAGIPEGSELDVKEILPEENTADGAAVYDEYAARAQAALGWEDRVLSYARFFDITILDPDGSPVQPAEGAAVRVSIRLEDWVPENVPKVVHFGEKTVVLDAEVQENTVSFDTSGFSVYAIVDAPEPVVAEETRVRNLAELSQHFDDDSGFYLSYGNTNYFTNTLNGNSAFVEKTSVSDASRWYFESMGVENTYRIYTLINDEKQYMQNPSGNLMGLTGDASSAVTFEISQAADGRFYFKKTGENKWLQHSGSGNGIRFFTDKNNETNTRIAITYASSLELEDDPYGLDGKTYGIAYHDGSVTASALTAEAKTSGNQQRLAGKDLVMRPDVLDHEGVLLVSADSDITEWTFENVRGDYYHLTTMVDGVKKYLTINGTSIFLADEPDETKSLIKAQPGTGANSHKWHFTVNNYSLNLVNTSANGFNAATGSGAFTWLNLVEKSVLGDDDFQTYNAKKVSVSDTDNVYNHQQVVIYTRVWNDTEKRYDFFAIDHDGSLIPCHDTGDGIEWVGSRVNSALWDFTEYYNTNGTVNYFYELQNVQYGEYISPQVATGRVTDGAPIGLNLNGRRYEENYTTIIAWDDDAYAYSGLKTENGRVVACPLSEAEDFYFAVINPVDPTDQLSTVPTVDNSQYGITMKMVDFNNPKTNTATSPRDSVQNPFFGGDNNQAGLLSTDLTNGYPITTAVTGNAGHSLSELFTGMTDVNHLFIRSIYNESGYFEYDSTSNFAHLNSNGNFTVYDQLGAIGDYTGYSQQGTFIYSGTHGQFMPYNDLTPGRYCTFTNQSSVTGAELSDLNPRKGEKLYNIGTRREVDYHFGMEMSAQFTQTASGLDAWGHDIIFEFSGDDDFWFYVDDELVLDLGGVHSAMTGSINFRTGVIRSSRGNTTLYDVFKSNYQKRGLSQAEIDQKLDEIFRQNEQGQYIFKDYTNHTMRMFYMERGAGASNLHMRFNLAAVKPSSFILTKKLSGTDSPANDLIEFPYQIYYYSRTDGGTIPHLLGELPGEADAVLYKDSARKVRHEASWTPAGGTAAYDHVFFLRPGEAAEVNMPEGVIQYYVVECGVKPSVYDRVSANGDILSGTPAGDPGRYDYRTGPDTLENRPQVDYVNHVREGAMRTLNITKKLYDVDGQTLLHYPDDPTLFSYRLYLGNESASPDNLPPANLYHYYVKDAAGRYCRWNASQNRFESLNITDYAQLSAYLNTLPGAQQESIRFVTSMNGSITKIPADYTVEVRDLIVGTQYKLLERDDEIPKGYTLRVSDGYTRVDVYPEITTGHNPFSGTMAVNETPQIEVRNQKGWGLTVDKIWSDKDFMLSHDPIYFAVYTVSETGEYTLLDQYVLELRAPDYSVYCFFDDLQSGIPFERYVLFEVALTGDHLQVNEKGFVTGFDSVTPISEGGTLITGGQPVGGEHGTFHYTVHYVPGDITGRNENIRTDTVFNTRPGIALYKTDLNGEPMAGAVFTLTDENGENVSAASYTSRQDGLITIAYLPDGTFYLTETEVPKGYTVLNQPLKIVQDVSGISFSGPDENLYTVENAQDLSMVTVTIKNRPVDFRVRKVDDETGAPLSGAHFALYRQVTDSEGHPRKDYLPISGLEDLITDEDGCLQELTMDLPFGTYYLTETRTVSGYVPLSEDLCFTVGRDGTVTVHTEAYASWLTASQDPVSKLVSYLLAVRNQKLGPVRMTVVCSKTLNGRDLKPEEFSFRMTPVDASGAPIGTDQIVYNPEPAAAGEESFFSFSFLYDYEDYEQAAYRDSDGNALFLYLLREDVSPNADGTGYDSKTGIRYDQNVYLVLARLHYDPETGLLTVNREVYPYSEEHLPLNEWLGFEVVPQPSPDEGGS